MDVPQLKKLIYIWDGNQSVSKICTGDRKREKNSYCKSGNLLLNCGMLGLWAS